MVVACRNYHCNTGNKFIRVWAYSTGEELQKYTPTREVTTITHTSTQQNTIRE
jgi:hypothetical protein